MTLLFNHFKYYSLNKKVIVCLIITGILSVSNHSYSQLPARFNRITNIKIEKRDSLYGVVDSNGKVIIPYEYQEIKYAEKRGYFKVKLNGKQGLINYSNQIIVHIDYDEIEPFYDGPPNFIKLVKEEKCFAVNWLGRKITKNPYSDMEILSNGIFLVLDDNKQFLMDTFGNILTKDYSEIIPNGNYFIVSTIKDSNFKSSLNSRQRLHDIYHCGGLDVYAEPEYKKAKYGLLDKEFKEIIPLKYNLIESQGIDLFLVMKNINGKNKFGYIDQTDKAIIPIKFDSISFPIQGMIIGKLENQFHFIDYIGKYLTSVGFDSFFHRYYDKSKLGFQVFKNGKCGLIDMAGKFILPIQYHDFGSFQNGLINVVHSNKFGYLDTNGKIQIPIIFDYCDAFHEGLALVIYKKKYGFIDTSCKIIIPFMYDGTFRYFKSVNGQKRLKVWLDNKSFWINERNQYIEEAKDE